MADCSEIVLPTEIPPLNCRAAPEVVPPGATLTQPDPSAVGLVARTTPALMLSEPLKRTLSPASTSTPLSFLAKPFTPLRLPVRVRAAPPTTSRLLLAIVPLWNWNARLVAKLPVARKVAAPPLLKLTTLPGAPRAPSVPAASTPVGTLMLPLKVFAALPSTTVPRPVLLRPPVPLSTPLSVSPCAMLEALAAETAKLPPPLSTIGSFSRSP